MAALTSSTDEGVELALALANGLSQWRRGTLAFENESRLAVRESLPEGPRLQRLCREVRAALAAPGIMDASEAINGMLTAAGAAPALMVGPDGRWKLGLRSRRSDSLAQLAVEAATGVASLIDDDDWDALKRCAADRCDDYFVDRTRNRSRRFCSRTCSNRVNSRNFRSRNGSGLPPV